jgi:hypothetical protein
MEDLAVFLGVIIFFACCAYLVWVLRCAVQRKWGTMALLIGLPVLCFYGLQAWNAPPNPWKRYGVKVEWRGYGNTGFKGPEYSVEFRGKTITELVGPGCYEYQMRSEDIDSDGIPEVILESGERRLVLAFRPPQGDKPPEFVTLSSSFGP